MLANAPMMAVLPATDLERVKDFYENKLGLKQSDDKMPGGLVFEAGMGTKFLIYERSESTKAEHTVGGFLVEDLEATVEELRGKGVAFEEYDMPGLKTENGIATNEGNKSAWFKDSEGNILAINQKM